MFARAREVKDGVFRLLESVPQLSPANVESATEYLEQFFDVIEDPASASREIVQACRPWL